MIDNFPFLFFDIPIYKKYEDKKYEDICNDYDVRVLESFDDLHKYNVLIYDITMDYLLKTFRDESQHAIKVGYTHGMIDQIRDGVNANMIVMPAEEYTNLPNSLSNKHIGDSLFKKLQEDRDSFCQLAYTGPYHFGSYLSGKHDKKKLKEIATEKLRSDIPEDRPFIVCYDGGCSSQRQIIYAANRLSKRCTVVYKTYKLETRRFLHLLKPEVILFDEGYHATNWLRFAADYILCEFCKSTFLSSILLGQYCLPFYSKIMNGYWFKTPISHIEMEKRYKTSKNREFLIEHWKYLFDIIQVGKIENAIFGNEYKNWYAQHIGNFRKILFGRYMLSGCDKKTAELIMKYIFKGDLGDDCDFLLVKQYSL